MKKASAQEMNDDLRPEYDLSQLKGGVRGKYYHEATAGTNLVLIDHELTTVFPRLGIGEPGAANVGEYGRSRSANNSPPARRLGPSTSSRPTENAPA